MEDWYPAEYASSLRSSLLYLSKCNIYFSNSGSNYWHFIYKLPIFIAHLIIFSLYILQLFVTDKDPFEEADIIPLWLMTIQVYLKNMIVMKNRNKVKELMDQLGAEWKALDLTEEQVKAKNRTIKKFNKKRNVFMNITMLLSWEYLLLPLFETLLRKLILAQDSKLKLAFACESTYPFSITNWYTYLAVYAFQFYSVLHIVYLYLGPDLLLINLSTYITTIFNIIQEDLVHIEPTKKSKYNNRNRLDTDITVYDEKKKSLRSFVKLHQRVIMFSEQLNGIFDKIIFINFFFSTLIITFLALATRASSGLMYKTNKLGAVIVFMSSLLFFCICSQMLATASEGVADAAMKNAWYYGDLSYQKSIYIILMRSQRQCSLTSFYSPISLNTFTKVLSTTWSYFSLVNSFYEERG